MTRYFPNFLVIIIGVTSCNYVKLWKKTEISGKILYGYFNSFIANSVDKCAEECSCGTGCKSFGFNTDTFNCSLYEYFAYSGSEFAPSVNQFYYWEVQDTCDTALGYEFNHTVSTCYKLYNDSINWIQAFDLCRADGGYLFIGDTAEKVSFMMSLLSGLSVHLGGKVLDEDLEWRWFNGVSINGSMWARKQPNFWKNKQYFLSVADGLHDIGLGELKSFLCELPIV